MTVLDPARPDAAAPAAAAPVSSRLVRGKEAVLALVPAWQALFERSGDAWVYVSAAWAESFLRGGWIGGEPMALTAWRGDELVGVLPLDVARKGPVRIARPIGTGFPSYLGVLADPAEPGAIPALADLAREADGFDLLLIDDLYSDDAATNGFLAALKAGGFSIQSTERANCHFIALPPTFEEYEQTFSGKRRRRNAREARQLIEAGAAVELVKGAKVTDAHLARVAAIQEDSWMKRRGAAVLGQPFYQQLLRRLADAGLVWLWLATIEGEDAAFVIGLGAHRRMAYSWPSFRLKFTETGVGRILTGWTIRDCCASMDRFDFGQGDGEYKTIWGNDKRLVSRATAARSAKGKLAQAGYGLAWRAAKVQALRSLRDRLRRSGAHTQSVAAAPSED